MQGDKNYVRSNAISATLSFVTACIILFPYIAIDFQFTQDEYLVREDAGTVMVCLEIATEGFLPRDVVMNLVTVDGNATSTYVQCFRIYRLKLLCIHPMTKVCVHEMHIHFFILLKKVVWTPAAIV